MKTLTVRKITATGIAAEGLSGLLDREEVPFNAIDVINWKEYPYQPTAFFRVAHTGDSILLNYWVEEKNVRACYEEDNGAVWTDSCVECFLAPASDGLYYNIESNCIGTVLLGAGEGRENRQHAPASVMKGIQRWASLGRKAFGTQGFLGWELSLIVPCSAFFRSEVQPLDGRAIRGNFYKCGDELPTPHFVSWNPIDAPQPDFHRPESFGQLLFE